MRSDHLSKHRRTHNKKGASDETENMEEDGVDKEDIIDEDGNILRISIEGMPGVQIVKKLTYAEMTEDGESDDGKEAEDCDWKPKNELDPKIECD